MNWEKFILALAIAIVVFVSVVVAIARSEANERVKYCKNWETGEVIVIEAGYPCPFPTSEI